ncbi:MAG: 2-oxo acid dehydrogenase subunit E2 [Candidatus Longimicrobiales bacterium M2_2A_002]
MPESDLVGPYREVPFRTERVATLDWLRLADRHRHQIPILLEVDVTDARAAIRDYRRRTGQGLSFTAWVVSCVGRAAAEHPRVHSVRKGKRRLVVFDEVDVSVLAEKPLSDKRGAGGDAEAETLPMPFVVRSAHRKPPAEIHEEIRDAQAAEVDPGSASIARAPSARLQAIFFRLPAWLRDLLYWRWLIRNPTRIRRTMGTVVVTSTGMASPGVLAWGIPAGLHPLAIGVGGIARRSTPDGDRDILALTIVFDHAVTDGAPVGRFAARLHELLTSAETFQPPEPGPPGA